MNGRRLCRPTTRRIAKARRPSRSAQCTPSTVLASEGVDTLHRLRNSLAALPDQGIDDVVMEVDTHVAADRHGHTAAEDQHRKPVECRVNDRRDGQTARKVHRDPSRLAEAREESCCRIDSAGITLRIRYPH